MQACCYILLVHCITHQYIFLNLSIVLIMDQALLDLHASQRNYNVVGEGEIPSVHWSEEIVDTSYVDTATERHMEALLSQILAKAKCLRVWLLK